MTTELTKALRDAVDDAMLSLRRIRDLIDAGDPDDSEEEPSVVTDDTLRRLVDVYRPELDAYLTGCGVRRWDER